jgi:hypothetical protein
MTAPQGKTDEHDHSGTGRGGDDLEFHIVNPNDETVGDPETGDGPVFVGSQNNVGLAMQFHDNAAAAGNNGYGVAFQCIGENGNRAWHLFGDNSTDFSLYTREGSIGDDQADLNKRLNINANGLDRVAAWSNLDQIKVLDQIIWHLTQSPIEMELDEPLRMNWRSAADLRLKRTGDGNNVNLWFLNDSQNRIWLQQAQASEDDKLRLIDRAGNVAREIHQSDASGVSELVDFKYDVKFGKSIRGMREVGAQPSAGDLKTQELAFSADYDGNGTEARLYKDTGGTVQVFEADSTL